MLPEFGLDFRGAAMLKRAVPFAVPTALFGLCVFLCHGVAGIYFGIGMKVGDAVIVQPGPDWKFPATVIGFSERGAKVRSEELGSFHGKVFHYAYDQCRVVSRDSDEWKELTGTAGTD